VAAPTFVTGDVPTAAQVNSWFVNTLCAYKTADESVTSSTAFQDDDHLTVQVEASCVYDLTLVLAYDGATAGDFKYQLVMPAGATVVGVVSGLSTTAAASTDDFTTSWTGAANLGGIGAGSTQGTYARGLLVVAGTAGTLKVQWAQTVSSGTATRLFTGSFISLRRLS
jgi:hypothetical protein